MAKALCRGNFTGLEFTQKNESEFIKGGFMQQDSTLVSLIIGRYGAAIWGIVALVLGKWGITFTDAETSQIMAGVSAVLSVFLICL